MCTLPGNKQRASINFFLKSHQNKKTNDVPELSAMSLY